MTKKVFITFLCLFLSVFTRLFAAYNSLGIPDSSEIRVSLRESWFEAPLSLVRTNNAFETRNQIGQEFQVRLEEDDKYFYIFVSPHTTLTVNVFTSKKTYTEQQDYYPGDVAGSFVLIRDKKTEEPLCARYYFLKNSGVYVQFTPYGKAALADLVIFENYAARGVATGLPFSYFYSASIEDVMSVTKNKLPWSYVLTSQNEYHAIRQMTTLIDETLPSIMYCADAMYDEDGKMIHVRDGRPFLYEELGQTEVNKSIFLSSAGFLKWICDGLVEPIAGSLLKREPLVKETIADKGTGRKGVLGQKYDLYFGLNWIRNLASAVISVYANKNYLFNQSGVDVTINPFSASITKDGISSTVTFVENTGYRSEVMKSLLYVLAATNPDTFYLGAIRETDRSVTPEVSVFNQNAAFFPYFMDNGAFDCLVFMNGRKMTLDTFLQTYKDSFVYLTRVKASEQFFPVKN